MSSGDVRRDYVWEKLYVALLSLLRSGSLEEQLEGAGLSLMRLRREEFINEDEFIRWSGIMERLTALEGTVVEGGIEATARG